MSRSARIMIVNENKYTTKVRDLKVGEYGITESGELFYGGLWEVVCLTNYQYAVNRGAKKGTSNNGDMLLKKLPGNTEIKLTVCQMVEDDGTEHDEYEQTF